MLTDNTSALAHSKRSVRAFLIFFVLVFIIFGGWAVTAQLNSASSAPGKIVTANKTQRISHENGGTLTALLVASGDYVDQGAPLLELNPVRYQSSAKILTSKYGRMLATKARLEAEQEDFREPVFPDTITQEQAATQQRVFNDKKQHFYGKKAILDGKVSQIETEITGYKRQQSALREQIRLNAQEINSISPLVSEGLVPRNELIALKTRKAELQERLSENETMLATAKQRISETALELLNLKNELRTENSAELKDVMSELGDAEQELFAANDMLERTKILAPVSGRIAHIKYRTPGSSIPPNAEIMALVPDNEAKIAEVRVNPQDIDIVRVGMESKVHITAYKSTTLPPLDGILTKISADSAQDETTGEIFYTGEIAITPASLTLLPDGETLTSGMLVDAMIVTGIRTPLQYLWAPVKDSFRKALNEK